MRVAFLAFDFGEYCVRLAGGIAQDSETTVLLLLSRDEAKPYRHLANGNVELREFNKPRIRQPLKQLRMVWKLVRQIRSFKPDVLHLQLGHMWFNLLGLPLLRDIPLVLTVHDSIIHVGDAASAKTPQWIYDLACSRATERIVHAPQVKKLLTKRTGAPAETVHVIPYVIVGDVDISVGKDVREEPEVLFFGRIWEYKGLEYLIKAEPLISANAPQTRIVIAGTGEDFARYRRMMVNPENFIVHNEYVSDEKRAELFRRARIVVLPYIEASQSFIISIAYRFGKPVVATTVGGLPEMVDHGRTGFLVAPRDVEGLAKAIVELMLNDEKRKQFGENGMRKVNVECAPEVVGQQTVMVYRKALKKAYSSAEELVVNGSGSSAGD
jgi:glycosyltransferase involved in cell wall biosynthesis